MLEYDIKNWYLFEQEMNANNSTNYKREILLKWKENPIIGWILRQTYDSYTNYHVSKNALEKLQEYDIEKVNKTIAQNLTLPELLILLSTRKITGHEALHTTKYFIDKCGYGDIVMKILNRDSELRTGTTLINEAFENLITVFKCQLAEKYDPKRVNLEDIWFMSRKLDGVRCLIIINQIGAISFYSRSGKEFLTLDKIRYELENLNLTNVVFDGEICSVDENGKEDFQGVMSEVTRKDYTMQNPKFLCFDMLKFDEFIKAEGNIDRPYSVRYGEMKLFFQKNFNHLELLEHIEITSPEIFSNFANKSKELKWEGYMLNRNVPYKGKRSFDLLKGKEMSDCECMITGYEMGFIRVIIDGKDQPEEMLSAIKVDFEGYEVSVGSGFSLEQRRHYFLHPEELIGNECTVQFFEKTKNKEGGISLRFPVIKAIYKGKRTI